MLAESLIHQSLSQVVDRVKSGELVLRRPQEDTELAHQLFQNRRPRSRWPRWDVSDGE